MRKVIDRMLVSLDGYIEAPVALQSSIGHRNS